MEEILLLESRGQGDSKNQDCNGLLNKVKNRIENWQLIKTKRVTESNLILFYSLQMKRRAGLSFMCNGFGMFLGVEERIVCPGIILVILLRSSFFFIR